MRGKIGDWKAEKYEEERYCVTTLIMFFNKNLMQLWDKDWINILELTEKDDQRLKWQCIRVKSLGKYFQTYCNLLYKDFLKFKI